MTYSVSCKCENCENIGTVDINKGTLVAAGLIGVPCPNCGCATLIKN